MLLKYIFDRIVSFVGLLFLWPVLLVVAVLIKIKMPGGPVFFVQKRVGKDGELFNCHKFRTMVNNLNVNLNDNVDANLNSSPLGEVGRGLLTLTITLTLTVLSLFGGRCDVIAFFEL